MCGTTMYGMKYYFSSALEDLLQYIYYDYDKMCGAIQSLLGMNTSVFQLYSTALPCPGKIHSTSDMTFHKTYT